MTAAHAYTRFIAKISSESMQKYLIDRGWKRRPYSDEGMLVFEGRNDDFGEPIIQVFPRSEQSPDYVMRVRELVNALSVMEERPVEDVLRDIRHETVPDTITPTSARPEAWNVSPKLLRLATIGLLILVLALLAGYVTLWLRVESDHRRTDEIIREIRRANEAPRR